LCDLRFDGSRTDSGRLCLALLDSGRTEPAKSADTAWWSLALHQRRSDADAPWNGQTCLRRAWGWGSQPLGGARSSPNTGSDHSSAAILGYFRVKSHCTGIERPRDSNSSWRQVASKQCRSFIAPARTSGRAPQTFKEHFPSPAPPSKNSGAFTGQSQKSALGSVLDGLPSR
jgi:hypothetical protein